ncbi:hypothetical protein DFP73DRAFT_284729 [Morchella snyderi]|nr:hypothetical protein DFP73DRAFT_284729 [Morchella snyderi]
MTLQEGTDWDWHTYILQGRTKVFYFWEVGRFYFVFFFHFFFLSHSFFSSCYCLLRTLGRFLLFIIFFLSFYFLPFFFFLSSFFPFKLTSYFTFYLLSIFTDPQNPFLCISWELLSPTGRLFFRIVRPDIDIKNQTISSLSHGRGIIIFSAPPPFPPYWLYHIFCASSESCSHHWYSTSSHSSKT